MTATNLSNYKDHAITNFIAGLCKGTDKNGVIGWIAVGIALVLVTLEKWLRGKSFGTTIVAFICYLLIQLSINNAPLKCILEVEDDDVKFLEIVQTVVCVVFCFLYSLLIFHEKN